MSKSKGKDRRPTDGELAILGVLWKKGPSTVREVNEALSLDEHTGYTTTLKLMQVMMAKGLLVRDESRWRHVYRPASSPEKTQEQIVRRLVDKVFAGSVERLVMRALSAKKVSAEELAKIKDRIKEWEGD